MASTLFSLRQTACIVGVLSAVLLGSVAGSVPTATAQTHSHDLSALEDQIEALQTALATLQTTVGTHATEIDTLETTTGTHATEIDTLETTTGTLSDNITGLETTTGTHTTEIDTLETTTGTLSDNITGLETTTGTHTTEIAALEEDLTGLEEDLTSLEENLESLEESIEDLKPNANVGIVTTDTSLLRQRGVDFSDIVSVKITPTSNSKRIRIRATILCSCSYTNTRARILRGETALLGSHSVYLGRESLHEFVLFDMPASTAEQTHKLQMQYSGGGNNYPRISVFKGTSLYVEEF